MFPKIYGKKNSIVLEYKDKIILADPTVDVERRPDIILISHAHSDHISKLSSVYRPGSKVIMSPATYKILRMQGFSFRGDDIVLVSPGDEVEIGSLRFRIRNAGHVIGSIMFEIDFGKIVVGFTGDFNFEGTNVLPPADIMDVDILVLDATYGKPIFSFPPREIMYRIIREKLKILLEEDDERELSLHGYALGKGQELTRLTWELLGIPACVDRNVAMYNKIYEDTMRKPLGNYTIGTKSKIYIRSLRSRKVGKNVKRILFTGWVALSGTSSKVLGFPLSSHNGFTKLVDYVIRVSPDFVYVAYGYKEDFSKFLIKEMGIPAKPIPESPEELKLRIRIVRGVKNMTMDAFS